MCFMKHFCSHMTVTVADYFFLGSEHITVPGISTVVPHSIGDKVTRKKCVEWQKEQTQKQVFVPFLVQ